MKENIVGNAYQELIEIVKKYAMADKPILFSGDRGTGKELFAELYFSENQRKGKKQSVNCAAFTETLLESEIFGHEIGSFTGADRKRNGLAVSCSSGILFLDELGASSREFQAKILRFVEYKKIKPVGSDEEKTVDCLVIAATNAIGNIRDDLRDRFTVLPVPPLQKDDIPLLVRHFLDGRTLIQTEMEHIMARDYPGNVRELKNECVRLRTEKGEEVLSKAGSDLIAEAFFDYKRYRQEMETWRTQITPILKVNGVQEFQYVYQPWPEASGEAKQWADLLTHGMLPDFPMPDEYDVPMLRLIEYLKKGIHHEEKIPYDIGVGERIPPEKILPRFRHHLRQYIEKGTLPCLLQELSLTRYKSHFKPDLYSLLNLPLDQALAQFKRSYLKYLLDRNDGDIGKAATQLGITSKSLSQKLRRMKT